MSRALAWLKSTMYAYTIPLVLTVANLLFHLFRPYTWLCGTNTENCYRETRFVSSVSRAHIGETQATKCNPMRSPTVVAFEKHIFLITIVHERAQRTRESTATVLLVQLKVFLDFHFIIIICYKVYHILLNAARLLHRASIYSRLLVIPGCRFIRFLRVELVWVYPCYLLCSFPCAVAVHDIDANRIVLPMAVDSTYL